MAASYKTPGVYVEEISKLPSSVAQVETAIPAFIGFTEKISYNGLATVNKPTRIKSLKEYEEIFGLAQNTIVTANFDADNNLTADVTVSPLSFRLYYALQLYFANGGGPCYITSIGSYITGAGMDDAAKTTATTTGLDAVKKEDEPTMLLFPDAPALSEGNFYEVYKAALKQSGELMDRVTLVDVFNSGDQPFSLKAGDFRTNIGNNNLSYGATYYPWLRTTLTPYINEELPATLVLTGGTGLPASPMLRKQDPSGIADPLSLYHSNSAVYFAIKKSLEKINIILPPSSAIAGVYAMVDNSRGVWKAPANVSLNLVKEPMVRIDEEDQRDMNVTDSGKSVNAIRAFMGKGILVWGARTLAGNDNEWRYVSVRRFFNMVEESVKKASEPFVFESNDANTWIKVKGMIENFLILQWRAGALQGAKPEDSFFVNVGLPETMTALDILEGRMIVEIGMAVVRPAEFIILRFSHKMAES